MNNPNSRDNSVKSDQEKLFARKKDAERKRLSRKLRPPKRRCEMTVEELSVARNLDRIRKQKNRMNLTSKEKEDAKLKDRERKKKVLKDMKIKEKEKLRVQSLICMRKLRLLQSEQSKSIARYKAKEGMRVRRREGPMREYMERNKKHIWAVKWRKFLSLNPKIRALDGEKKREEKRRKDVSNQI